MVSISTQETDITSAWGEPEKRAAREKWAKNHEGALKAILEDVPLMYRDACKFMVLFDRILDDVLMDKPNLTL